MIVYTAIYGGYDLLWPVDSDCELVCYTDDPTLHADGWKVVVEPRPFDHPRLSAKWRKCHPPESDRSIWVDGSCQLTDLDAYVAHAKRRLDDVDLLLFDHPYRDDVTAEAAASLQENPKKYAEFDLHKQVALYGETEGLWQTTSFARRHTPDVLQFGAAWFAHCQLLSPQDQLSLPYLIGLYQLTVEAVPDGFWATPWFDWRGHLRDD